VAFPTLSVAGALERSFCGAAAGCVAASCIASGLTLCLRRLSGGFDAPAATTMLAVTSVGAALVLLVDGLARAAATARSGPWPVAARAGLVLALAAIALPLRLASPLDCVSFAAAVLFAGAVIGGPWLAAGRPRTVRPRLAVSPPTGSADVEHPSGRTGEVAPAAAAATSVPGHLLQRFERYDSAGTDCLRGRIAVAVPQGARTAHGHVGFCPPFAQTPVVEVTTEYDGVEAVVSAAEILPWGVRIECRLDEPAEEAFEIPVDLFASAPV
jgi:hypothetical protein